MFTHLVPVRTSKHTRGQDNYEIVVYRAEETGAHRLFVSKGGFGVGDIFEASDDSIRDAALAGRDLVEELISIAKSDIERNEFGLY